MKGHVALVRWRKREGISQAEAARRIGGAQSTWARWETGHVRPEYETAARIELRSDGFVRVEQFGYDAGPSLELARAPWRALAEGGAS
jgi:transcriptional regulator with XRE-family HTH domain